MLQHVLFCEVGASYSRPLLSLSGGGYAGGGGQYTQHRFEVRRAGAQENEEGLAVRTPEALALASKHSC